MGLIKIDLADVVANMARGLPRLSDTRRLQMELGASAMQHWKQLAKTKLLSSSASYTAALSHRSTESREYIVLTGVLPNMIEGGFKGGDMRDWMLKGAKSKMGKNGRYLTIPFRHGSKGTGGRNVGAEMPTPIYNAAKKLDGTKSKAKRLTGEGGKSTLHGKRLEPHGRGVSKQVTKMLNTKAKDWHTTSIYTGMQRTEKQYESANQTGGYTTFRRISTNTRSGIDPKTGQMRKSWHHPGIKAVNFAPKVRERVEQLAPIVLRQILGE
jgi:hypothetical protein